MSQPTTPDAVASDPPSPPRRRRRLAGRLGRGGAALAAAVALSTAVAGTALAVTAITPQPTPSGVRTVGPVNGEYGFPAWYEDTSGQRVELCLDGNDPMCGFVAAPVAGFDNTAPTVFPTNFPDETFYFTAGSTLTLPNGGRAVLTLSLEAAFLNSVTNGDQMTFARQRVFVTNGPPSTELTFTEPYGTIRVDTDAGGRAHFTQDISPAVGNFATALKSGLGPFLTATTGPIVTDSGTYLGDPAIPTTVKNGPNGNKFAVDYGTAHAETDQFTVQGKISTNTGFDTTSAVATPDGRFVDVFATSKADGGEIYVGADAAANLPSTPMVDNGADGLKTFYARVPVGAVPDKVTLSNLGDKPASTLAVPVTKAGAITVTDASYDGAKLHVAATGAGTLSVAGYPASTLVNGEITLDTVAPPGVVTVTDGGTNSGTAPLRVTAGAVSRPGQPPVTASPKADPICTVLGPDGVTDVVVPCVNGAPAAGAGPKVNVTAPTAAVALGESVTLDASTSTNATSYEWTWVSGPQVTITNGTTAKPTIKLTPYDVSKYALATLPKSAQATGAVVSVVAVNGTGPTATRSAPTPVTIPVRTDTLGPLTTRFTAGKEYRIDGTSTVTGGSLVLNPPTSVAVYNTTTGRLVGTAAVDTAGAWSLRLRSPFVAGQDLARTITVVTSRGAYATGLVAGAPNV